MSYKIGITCYPTYGGSGVVAAELGKALSERGHIVHFISYAPPPGLEPQTLWGGFGDRIYFGYCRVRHYQFRGRSGNRRGVSIVSVACNL